MPLQDRVQSFRSQICHGRITRRENRRQHLGQPLHQLVRNANAADSAGVPPELVL